MDIEGKTVHELAMEWDGDCDEDNSDSGEVMTTEVDPSMAVTVGCGPTNELPIDMSEWSAEEVTAYNALRSKRKKCCIGGCTPRSLPIARSYHQLPVRNLEIWAKWVEVIRWSRNEPDWSPNGEAAPLVCSRHFPDTDFISYEASSRVRLSHTAIPLQYVEPPEGTSMDIRFNDPLPLPPLITGGRAKLVAKSKNAKVDVQINQSAQFTSKHNSGHLGSVSKFETSPQYEDNYGYDIEEAGPESYQGLDDLESDSMEEYYYPPPQVICKPSINFEPAKRKPVLLKNRARISAPPTLVNFQKQKVQVKSNGIPSKLPGLIRANFAGVNNVNGSSKPAKASNAPNITTIKREVQPTSNRSLNSPTYPTKHKIGLAKCKLIVQTLENQLKIAKTRLAEQLDIPYSVVHGVWNMKESLKTKF